MRLSYQTITWGGVVGHPVGVTSIKDLFYLANGSTEAAVRDIAAAGYSGVEIFDGNLRQYEDRPGDLRRLLDGAGVSLVAVYTGADAVAAGCMAFLPTLANATLDALRPLGIQHLDMPLTPSKLWHAMQAAKQTRK
jgi:inosose dehydratase